jgi:hypothetical protein
MILLLPLGVSSQFLFEWLEIQNICFLDTAFCNKLQRRLFLNILNECIAAAAKCLKLKVLSRGWVANKHFGVKLFLKDLHQFIIPKAIKKKLKIL